MGWVWITTRVCPNLFHHVSIKFISNVIFKKVQVGKDQEKAQSEKSLFMMIYMGTSMLQMPRYYSVSCIWLVFPAFSCIFRSFPVIRCFPVFLVALLGT